MKLNATSVRSDLRASGNPRKVAETSRFFRAIPGGYGEGDRFWAVRVPAQRKIARTYRELPREEVAALLGDPCHECRLTALFILVSQFEKGDAGVRDEIALFYLDHLDRVNNWDLVDASAPKILGPWLVTAEDRSILYELARSENLWHQRTAMMACFAFIRENDFRDLIALADEFLGHPHDLIHKAAGWMLREMGKRDAAELRAYLATRYRKMPRTMLRYAIEKFEAGERAAYLNGSV